MGVNGNRIQELTQMLRSGKLTEAERVQALEELLAEIKALEKSIDNLIPTPQTKRKYTITDEKGAVLQTVSIDITKGKKRAIGFTVTDKNGNTYTQSIKKIASGRLTAQEREELLAEISKKIKELEAEARENGTEILDTDFLDLDTLDLDFDLEGIGADFPDLTADFPELEEMAADLDILKELEP